MLDSGHEPTLELGTLGARIRATRQARELGVTETAKKIGISRTSFGAWEADSVTNPDTTKLHAFCRLTDVSLDWLMDGKGDEPDFLAARAKRVRPASASVQGDAKAPAGSKLQLMPEIAPPLSAHASALDLTARAYWTVPADVLELGFNANPERTVIKRVVSLDGTPFQLSRGDYVLIDTSRVRIDEPGVYVLADPDGVCALRALVDDKLKITKLGDDARRNLPIPTTDKVTVLGRVMGIFKPA